MIQRIGPVKLSDFRKVLKTVGCKYDRMEGDHEIWIRQGMKRPVVFPVKHKELVPRIVKSNLNTLDLSEENYLRILNSL